MDKLAPINAIYQDNSPSSRLAVYHHEDEAFVSPNGPAQRPMFGCGAICYNDSSSYLGVSAADSLTKLDVGQSASAPSAAQPPSSPEQHAEPASMQLAAVRDSGSLEAPAPPLTPVTVHGRAPPDEHTPHEHQPQLALAYSSGVFSSAAAAAGVAAAGGALSPSPSLHASPAPASAAPDTAANMPRACAYNGTPSQACTTFAGPPAHDGPDASLHSSSFLGYGDAGPAFWRQAMGSITGPSGGSSAVPPEAGAMPAGCESCGLQDASQALHGGLTQRDPMPPMGSYTGSDDSGGTSTCRQAAAAAAAADATPPPQLAAAACGREATGCEAGGCEGAEEEEGGGGGGDTDIETEDALGDWDDLVGVDDVVVLPEEDLQPHLLAHQVGQAGGNGLLDAAHQHHGGEDAAAAGSGGSAQQQAPPAAAQPGGGLRAPLAKPLPAVLPAPIHVMVGPQTTRKRKRQREKRARATRSGSSSGGGGAVAGGGGAEGQFNSDTDAALARMALPALLATVPAGNVVGLFHPDRYLKGGDCIACGMGMVSRSRFEKVSRGVSPSGDGGLCLKRREMEGGEVSGGEGRRASGAGQGQASGQGHWCLPSDPRGSWFPGRESVRAL